MGRNDNTWSDRHRSAIGYAQTELGMSSTKACEAAKKGELGLPPFDMPASTAREIAQAYERGEVEPPNVDQTAEDHARRQQAWINRELGQLLAKPKVQHYELKRLAELQISVCAMVRKPAGPQRLPRTRAKPNGEQTTPELIANLLQQTDPQDNTESETGSG